MKNYSLITKTNSPRNIRSKRFKTLLGITLVLVFLIVTTPFVAKTAAKVVLFPIIKVEEWFVGSTHALPMYFKSKDALNQQLDELTKQLALKQDVSQESKVLLAENAMLRELQSGEEREGIVAAVTLRPPHLPYDSILIDRGSADGVVEGAPVYAEGNIAIGVTSVVYEHSSLVILVSSAGFESTVYVFGPNIYTTGYGQGDGVIKIGVPQGILLAIGDAVVLPALQTGIFGFIEAVDSTPSDPEQFAYIMQPVPIQSLRYVRVGDGALTTTSFDEARAAIDEIKIQNLTVPLPDGVLVDIETSTTTVATSTASSTL